MAYNREQAPLANRAMRKPLVAQPKPWEERLANFFESKIGFWIFSTLFAGALTALGAIIPSYLNRVEAAKKDLADSARRDADTVLKLSPLLFSKEDAPFQTATALLTHLQARAGFDQQLSEGISKIFDARTMAGVAPNASPEDLAKSEQLSAMSDANALKASREATSPPPNEVETAPAQPQETAATTPLPVRVYIQFSHESQRKETEALQVSLRKQKILVPRVEFVKKVPQKTELRYCRSKMDADLLQLTQIAIDKELATRKPSESVKLAPLLDKFCNAVRFNHTELWVKAPASLTR